MALRVYNTLTGRKERFEPIEAGLVKMFVCGPTVYDLIHLGHARTYIFYDILARYLTSQGYRVQFVVNITDLDEKVFQRARNEGESYWTLAERYTKRFYDDLACLGVDTITRFAKASDYVEQATRQVETLVKKGCAYTVSGITYFSVSCFPDYGMLSHQSPLELKLRRINSDPKKRSQTDFPLWTVSGKDEPYWIGPLGKGRPGWHIEDTAISITIFGPKYDIHGGAIELVFPHHEAEIAQAESLTGERPFVKYWIHTGILLDVHGRKMSKSLGNSINVRDAVSNYSSNILRLYFVLQRYRRPMKFDEGELKKTEEYLDILHRPLSKIETLLQRAQNSLENGEGEIPKDWMRYVKEFFRAMDDDIDTPRALKSLLSWAIELEEMISDQTSIGLIREVYRRFHEMLWIMGLRLSSYSESQRSSSGRQ